MATQNLRDIRAFPDLVRYLEDELDWPLQEYGFDDLTFEYTPAELGLKEEDAARIKAIHQLRPLASGQPWGIFFVEFENKKLPVVVLRRILSHLALKKRASANKASAPAWHAEDLLFITAFGEDNTDAREIAFAHFHQNPGDMPTLHVLGWDGGDTPLKLANVDHVLRERLRWPDDEKDTQAWRETWSKPFRHRIGHVITTASLLAEELASLARGIRDKAKLLLAAESEKGEITKLFKAFQTALIHDLSPDSFADTYAQTITYGLLTAAISRTDTSEGRYGTFVKADDIAEMVPITNPFLKEMLQTFLKVGGRKGGINFDELGIQDVVELLRGDETDLPAILRDFGNKTRGEDPVIHFYEHFLSAYNKKLKIQRGVFYTPQPVVSYIVRSVHELLQTEFGLEDGLASTITWGEMAARQIPPSPPFSKGGVSVSSFEKEGRKEVALGTVSDNETASFPPLKKGGEGGFKIPEGTSPDEPFVVILDPATGTATFLVEVINVIHRTLTEKWAKQGMSESQRLEAWNDYVPKHLLPRLYGYELMMAPYAIAHMKIGLKLAETGYRFGSDERVRVYLTNALEPAHEVQPQLEALAPALAHEAQAVAKVKRDVRFTVIVGNPPYSGHSSNDGDWIVHMLHGEGTSRGNYFMVDGAPLGERNPKWLNDDYVKFMRLGQWQLERTGCGTLGFITNHGYLDNPTFRGMRQSLMQTFDRLYLYDLHGNSKKKEKSLDGGKDENVFDIMQGVAIGVFAKRKPAVIPAKAGIQSLTEILDSRLRGSDENGVHGKVFHADLYSTRASKYAALVEQGITTTPWQTLHPQSSAYLFAQQDIVLMVEYEQGWKITDTMPLNVLGFQSHRDGFATDFDRSVIENRMSEMRDKQISDSQILEKYALSNNRDWQIASARKCIQGNVNWQNLITQCAYRPFDQRWSYFDEAAMDYPRRELKDHVLNKQNLCLNLTRNTNATEWRNVLVSELPAPAVYVEIKEGSSVFPLYLYPREKQDLLDDAPQEKRANFSPEFLWALKKEIGDLPLTPEDVFAYLYAVLYAPGYRTRYAEFLKRDFPRIPLTADRALFKRLVDFGQELVALHLLESPKLAQPITEFIGGKTPEVEKPSWSNNTVWVDKAQTTGFKGVREEVWNFHIGGYQVCQKWLKDRKGRTLSNDDITHYQKIVIALSETIRLMAEIDKVIETHGGWPDAFASAAGQDAHAATDAAMVEDYIAPPPTPVTKKSRAEPAPDLFSIAPAVKPESEPAPPAPRTTHADDLDRDELCAEIRKLFSDGAVRERDAAIDELARALGHQRTGKNIRETLDNALRTAVRRGILQNDHDQLSLLCRSIEQFERDFLKDQFLASLGRTWIAREDAIRAFARWLGFARTGGNIEDAARSLINGLIREGRLEVDGGNIRKS